MHAGQNISEASDLYSVLACMRAQNALSFKCVWNPVALINVGNTFVCIYSNAMSQ